MTIGNFNMGSLVNSLSDNFIVFDVGTSYWWQWLRGRNHKTCTFCWLLSMCLLMGVRMGF